MQMKYRAVVVGIEEDGHPVQELSNNFEVIRAWSIQAAKTRNSSVQIFRKHLKNFNYVESLFLTVAPPSEPDAA